MSVPRESASRTGCPRCGAHVALPSGIWKNAGDALAGTGDIDSSGSPQDWGLIEAEFDRGRLNPADSDLRVPATSRVESISSLHRPAPSVLLEMSVRSQGLPRVGSVHLRDLVRLWRLKRWDFAVFAPAGGPFQARSEWGDAGWQAERSRATQQARAGASAQRPHRLWSSRFDVSGRPARRLTLAQRASLGDWEQNGILATSVVAFGRALVHPAELTRRRIIFILVAKRRCPVLRALLKDHRRVPTDRAAWLAQCRVSPTHAEDADPARSPVARS